MRSESPGQDGHYTALEEVSCHTNIHSPEGYAEEEITGVIAESIASHRGFAQRRLAAYRARCTTFEQRYGMSTETFLERFEAGALGDQPEWFDWYAAAQGNRSGVGNTLSWRTSHDHARVLWLDPAAPRNVHGGDESADRV